MLITWESFWDLRIGRVRGESKDNDWVEHLQIQSRVFSSRFSRLVLSIFNIVLQCQAIP
jgi:hypothetical protein